jgi:hypothetical protein
MMFAVFLFCFIQSYAKPPIPEALWNAKTAVVKNGGADSKDFTKFCDALKEWGRFEFVQDKRKADIVITLSTGVGNRNMERPDGGGVISLEVLINYIRIIDARDDTMLWSDETEGGDKNPKLLVSYLKSKMKKK